MSAVQHGALLSLRGINKSFGGVTAARAVDMDIVRGEIVSLIGPNGAGKTTLFNIITGFIKPSAGTVLFRSAPITGLPPQTIAARGIVRTFQITNVFPGLSVAENLQAAQYLRLRTPMWRALTGHRSAHEKRASARRDAVGLLELVGLAQVAEEPARHLAYGQLRLVEIAIGLAASPQLLLLDEPAAGLNNEESLHLVKLMRRICRDRGITLLLVEHDMDVVMSVSDRVIVMNFGEKIAEGRPDEVKNDERVIEAYLGGDAGDDEDLDA